VLPPRHFALARSSSPPILRTMPRWQAFLRTLRCLLRWHPAGVVAAKPSRPWRARCSSSQPLPPPAARRPAGSRSTPAFSVDRRARIAVGRIVSTLKTTPPDASERGAWSLLPATERCDMGIRTSRKKRKRESIRSLSSLSRRTRAVVCRAPLTTNQSCTLHHSHSLTSLTPHTRGAREWDSPAEVCRHTDCSHCRRRQPQRQQHAFT
jgi:hypothetical protein